MCSRHRQLRLSELNGTVCSGNKQNARKDAIPADSFFLEHHKFFSVVDEDVVDDADDPEEVARSDVVLAADDFGRNVVELTVLVDLDVAL